MSGVDPKREQPWTAYALSLLAFSAVSVVGLYLLQRLQGSLPLNPTNVAAVPPALAFNTAVSFVTNTNWQNYGGESTMSHLTQMAGLTVQNFVSAAVGIAVAVALDPRPGAAPLARRSGTSGSTSSRTTTRVLLPLSFVFALVLVSQGVVQSLRGPATATTVEGATQTISGAARSPARRRSRSSARTAAGPSTRTPRTRSRTRRRSRTSSRCSRCCAIPFALTYAFGRLVGRPAAGLGDLRGDVRALDRLCRRSRCDFEADGNPKLDAVGASQQPAATWRARRSASAPAASGLFAASTTGTSTGAVNSRARQLHAARRRASRS